MIPSKDGSAAISIVSVETTSATETADAVTSLRSQLDDEVPDGHRGTGDRAGRRPGRPGGGVRRRRLPAARSDGVRGGDPAGDHLPQPDPVGGPAGGGRDRRPGGVGAGDADAGRARGAVGRVDDRHPVGARLRSRDGLRPAADLALPRRAARARGPPRGHAPRPAAYGGRGAGERDHRRPRRALPDPLADPDHPCARDRVRRRHRGGRGVRPRRPAGDAGALRTLGVLAEGAHGSARSRSPRATRCGAESATRSTAVRPSSWSSTVLLLGILVARPDRREAGPADRRAVPAEAGGDLGRAAARRVLPGRQLRPRRGDDDRTRSGGRGREGSAGSRRGAPGRLRRPLDRGRRRPGRRPGQPGGARHRRADAGRAGRRRRAEPTSAGRRRRRSTCRRRPPATAG